MATPQLSSYQPQSMFRSAYGSTAATTTDYLARARALIEQQKARGRMFAGSVGASAMGVPDKENPAVGWVNDPIDLSLIHISEPTRPY